MSASCLPRPIAEQLAEQIAGRLLLIGQPVRIRLVDRLEAGGRQSVNTLAEEIGVNPYNASQHLSVLRRAGVVRRRQVGRLGCYKLVDDSVVSIYELVSVRLADELRELGRELEGLS